MFCGFVGSAAFAGFDLQLTIMSSAGEAIDARVLWSFVEQPFMLPSHAERGPCI